MRRLRFWLGLPLIVVCHLAWADTAADLLARAAHAARTLDYSGIYLYRDGDHIQVMSIAHRVDGKTDKVKVDVLDGPHREFLQLGNQVLCRLENGPPIRLENSALRRFFPSLLPADPSKLFAYYQPVLGSVSSVAGRPCQEVRLVPKDAYRYTHVLWLDDATGLPLKARVLDNEGKVIAFYVFSQISIGAPPPENIFHFDAPPGSLPAAVLPETFSPGRWVMHAPPGYHEVLKTRRPLPGRSTPVNHIIFTDGLSAVSLFIEPASARDGGASGLSQDSSVKVYSRRYQAYRVTAMGEVPAATLIDLANSVELK